MILFMTVWCYDFFSFFFLFFVGYRALEGGVWMFVYPCCDVECVGWMHGWCVKNSRNCTWIFILRIRLATRACGWHLYIERYQKGVLVLEKLEIRHKYIFCLSGQEVYYEFLQPVKIWLLLQPWNAAYDRYLLCTPQDFWWITSIRRYIFNDYIAFP